MKKVLMITVMILAVGILGRMEYDDEQRNMKQDELNKIETLKEWEIRCYKGDIFDEQICKELLK